MEIATDTCISFESYPEDELIKTMDPTNKFRWALNLADNPAPELQQAWRSRYNGEHYWVPVPIVLLNAEAIRESINVIAPSSTED